MKKKSYNLIIILSTILIVTGIIVSSFTTEYATVISTVATTATAIIGAVALFFQFKKDKEVNQASFLIEFSKTFFETYDCKELFEQLDKETTGTKFVVGERTVPRAVRYLEWCEELASLEESGVLTLQSIDNFLSYRFFLITNHKKIQELEILDNLDYYQGIISLHKKWTAYKRKHNKPMPFDKTNLTDVLEKISTINITDNTEKKRPKK